MSKCVNNTPGFTLIELAIVLVIIGLVVGGVLAGRDLINTAQMRLVISQTEKFNAAALTFKTKYKLLPGDISNPSDYGLSGTAGNGDGCITRCFADFFPVSGSYYMTQFEDFGSAPDAGWEISNFWRHLSEAGLIGGHYDGHTSFNAATSVGSTMPPVINKPKSGWLAYMNHEYIATDASTLHMLIDSNAIRTGNIHHFFGMFTVIEGGGDYLVPTLENNTGFDPLQAAYIDTKTDDGYPGSGGVRAYFGDLGALAGYDWDLDFTFIDAINGLGSVPGTPPNDGLWCAYIPSGTVRWVYNVRDSKATCGLRIRAAF